MLLGSKMGFGRWCCWVVEWVLVGGVIGVVGWLSGFWRFGGVG